MKRTILLVDESSEDRKILRKLLADDYEIIEATNGKDAIEVLESEYTRISAVILGLDIPDTSGFEVLEKMHNKPYLKIIPVIATGKMDDSSEAKALKLGAHDYIVKPYNSTILKQRIDNTINFRETATMLNEIQHDKLTGLLNRESFFAEIFAMYSKQEPGYYVLSCFNVENFKIINDQLGTDTGDKVLKHIATALDAWAQENEGLCSRIMADNFALLYSSKLIHAKSTFDTIDIINAPPCVNRPIVIKIGRCLITDPALPAGAVYDRAAMTAVSIKGRYDAFDAMFDESMLDSLLHEQQIVLEMESALKQGQFEPWFQPQYDHSKGALIGAETLVRWRHPERGLISPGLFVPIFEKNGFIYEMDKSIWEQVCKLLRRWIDAGRNPMPVSVNISRYDIFKDDLIDVITGLTKKYDIPLDLLRLEITETAFSKAAEQIMYVVQKFVDLGFTVEIDDFGSGYSSLNTLKDVPAQIVKLDMHFLKSKNNSERGGNIIESIVHMVKGLGMSVIVEGVETTEQAEYLLSVGANYVQGFLYAHPMPLSEYEELAADAEKEERLLSLSTIENFDNNTFWDPESMDTLIFNSYIGGACIYEYCRGRVKLLRANRKYLEVICGAGEMPVDDAFKLELLEHLDEENKAKLIGTFELAIKTKDEVTDDFILTNLPGCVEKTYLRTTFRVITVMGDRYLIYCTNENITDQREAELREKIANEQIQAILKDMYGGISATIYKGSKIETIFSNDRFYQMRGYTKEQYLEEVSDYFSIIHPEDRERIKKNLRRSIQTVYKYATSTVSRLEKRLSVGCEQTYHVRTLQASSSRFLSRSILMLPQRKKQRCQRNMHLINFRA